MATLVVLATMLPDVMTALASPALGWDYDLYMAATRRWLAGGGFFEPYQLAGTYQISHGDVLYPPVALWLFVPFTALPAAAWWVVPSLVVAAVLIRLRPVPLSWPIIAICVAWPPTLVKFVAGNPVIWATAAMALGVVVAGPAVFVLIKTSLAPFALWGVRHKSWWLWLAIFGLMCVPFGPMWLDWLTSVSNAQGGGLIYSWQEIPMLILPIAAWLGRRSGPMGPTALRMTRTSPP